MNYELIEENKKLRDNLKKMRKQLSKLKIEYDVQKNHIQRIVEFNTKLNPQLDLKEISKIFFDFLIQIFSFESGVMILNQGDVEYSYQVKFNNNSLEHNILDEKNKSFYYKIASELNSLEKTVLLEDINIEEIKHAFKNKTCMLTPLKFENQNVGIVILENHTVQSFSQREVDLIEELILNVGKILVNALLFSKITEASLKDELTGVYNRRYFMELLQFEIERTKKHNKNFALVLADIDHFKNINDRFGHPYGDKVLRQVAKKIENSIRGCDVLGRYGGEEFIFLFPDTDLLTAKIIAEKVKEEISKYKIKNLNITFSFGITEYNTSKDIYLTDLIKEADEALYQAKKQGRNRVILYGE